MTVDREELEWIEARLAAADADVWSAMLGLHMMPDLPFHKAYDRAVATRDRWSREWRRVAITLAGQAADEWTAANPRTRDESITQCERLRSYVRRCA